MYHRVGRAHNEWERRYCISPERFDAHMQCLADRGMQACSLEDFFAWRRKEKALAEGSFLLTFDDGFLGVYEHAAPVLQQLGWPATVFLVSGLIGGRDEWCKTENPSGATYPLLAPAHIRAMREMAFDFQSHTRLHADLTTLSDDQLTSELHGSRTDLQELLDDEVRYLAYPYGRYTEQVIAAARSAGFEAAFSTQPGFNRHDIDLFRVRRLDISGTDTPSMLCRKIHFGCNDGSWRQSVRYYSGRLANKLGLRP